MKTASIIFTFLFLGVSTLALSQSGFVQKGRFPLSWVKQASQDQWGLVIGTTGPYRVSASLVQVKENVQERKLASVQGSSPVVYSVDYIKKNIHKVSESDLKNKQLMVLITAP